MHQESDKSKAMIRLLVLFDNTTTNCAKILLHVIFESFFVSSVRYSLDEHFISQNTLLRTLALGWLSANIFD